MDCQLDRKLQKWREGPRKGAGEIRSRQRKRNEGLGKAVECKSRQVGSGKVKAILDRSGQRRWNASQGKEVKRNQVTAMGGGANLADMANLVADVIWRM